MLNDLISIISNNWLDIYMTVCTIFVTVKIVFHQLTQFMVWLETKSLW